MLFWESLSERTPRRSSNGSPAKTLTIRTRRLPYDRRCIALTKAGTRCRGRIRPGSDLCLFHDPNLAAERRKRMAAKRGQNRRRFSHLPDGYLRKLSTRTAVGEAMDRLYREIRLGTVSIEMGEVLFKILTRLLDSELVKSGPCPDRSKAARIRPKLSELLTREERAAWKKAVEKSTDTPPGEQRHEPRAAFERAVDRRHIPQPTSSKHGAHALPAAS